MTSNWTDKQKKELGKIAKNHNLSVPEDAPEHMKRANTHLRTTDGREAILKKTAIPEQGEPIRYSVEYEKESGEIDRSFGSEDIGDEYFDNFRELKQFIKNWV